MSTVPRLSVPEPRLNLPRALASEEYDQLVVLADALCGPSDRAPLPSDCANFGEMLDLALSTRRDRFDDVIAAAESSRSAADTVAWLRALHDNDPGMFQVLSTVLAGAYLMVSVVRDAIGYPGQHRSPPRAEEAVDQIMDGILDPVIDRGFIFVDPPTES